MEADEMMDDDLFADLYGDEEPKKQVSNATELSVAANGMATTSAKPTAPSASSVSAVKVSEKASDLRSASGAPTTAAPQTQQAHTSSNENNGQDIVDEDNYQGWDSQQNKGDTSNGGNNDYQGYGGYEQEGDGYGDYSGGGNGNMVDVGGSTAIKEDGCVYNLLATLHALKTSLLYLSPTYLSMCLSLPTSLLKREEELELEWHWYKMLGWRGCGSWGVGKVHIQPSTKQDEGLLPLFYRYYQYFHYLR
ncbi:hypothetical protein EV426DRAFT_604999 [Tirmania nivea]|nr:hypothetical protein EV426DRAFT_604999 [Tirmania nivea]